MSFNITRTNVANRSQNIEMEKKGPPPTSQQPIKNSNRSQNMEKRTPQTRSDIFKAVAGLPPYELREWFAQYMDCSSSESE